MKHTMFYELSFTARATCWVETNNVEITLHAVNKF
jgi:hypothetical protein